MPSPLEKELYASALQYMNEHMPQAPKKAIPTKHSHAQLIPSNISAAMHLSSSYTSSSLSPNLTNVTVQSPSSVYPASFQDSIDKALENAWAPATLKTYSTGINAYVTFCRLHHIPSNLVYPASEFLLCAFVSSKQGLSPATLKNYVTGLRAWHIRGNHIFPTSERIKLIVKTTIPKTPSLPPKRAISIQMLECLALHLSNSAFDTAVLACACTAFWGLCRLGELLPSSLTTAETTLHQPLPSHVNSLPKDEFQIHLPYTKIKREKGEDIFLSQQHGPSNPVSALQKQLNLRLTYPKHPLFSFTMDGVNHTLTKAQFLSHCNSVWESHNFPRSTGHSFRIGGTTHLLLCGIDPNVIKKVGRWSSDSYLRYWRNLDDILPSRVRFASPLSRPSRVGKPQSLTAAAGP